MDTNKDGGTQKVDSGRKEISENDVQNDATVVTSEQNLSKECAAVQTNGHCVDVFANNAADLDVSLNKRKSSSAQKTSSGLCVTPGDMAENNQTKVNVSGHKALLTSKVESDNNEGKVGKVLVRHVESEEKVKNASVELDGRPSKKAKLSSEFVDRSKDSMPQPRFNSDAKDKETVVPTVSAADDKNECKSHKDSFGTEKGLSKMLKPVDKTAVLSNGKLLEASSRQSHYEDHKSDGQDLEVTPRPNAVSCNLSSFSLLFSLH